jgi:hypothetical protein
MRATDKIHAGEVFQPGRVRTEARTIHAEAELTYARHTATTVTRMG